MPTFNFDRNIRFQLSYIKLNGHKSIEDLETKVEPGLNILIGKNGAGKSNFFEFLKMINRSLLSFDQLTFKSSELTFIGDDGSVLKYGIYKLNHRQVDEEAVLLPYRQLLEINNELIFDTTDENLATLQIFPKRRVSPRNMAGVFSRLKINYPRTVYVGFGFPMKILGLSEPVTISIPFDMDELWNLGGSEVSLLDGAFDDLESYLQDELNEIENQQDYDEQYREILLTLNTEKLLEIAKLDETALESLKKFSPIQQVRINRNLTFYNTDTHLFVDNLKLDFLVNDNWLPWSQLSDGTKRLFLIISEVSRKHNKLILIEEPELGIHPHQFDLVMQFVKEQSTSNQIIISTHSPKALDILEEDELGKIMIASYKKGEGTKINHLNSDQIRKSTNYMNEVAYLSDYWLLSDLES